MSWEGVLVHNFPVLRFIILTEPFPLPVDISVIALKVRGFMLLSIMPDVACTY